MSNQLGSYLAVIKVVGIGGGGTNAVTRMVEAGLSGVEFVAVNTDAQALLMTEADEKIHIGSRVKGIRPVGDELTLVLRRGTEIRLGRATEVGLKLTVAARVLRLVDGSTAYVDVSVPQRPVAG